MRVLHVLDHSLPVQSGYAFRSAAILREQRRLGWEVLALTGPKQGGGTAPRDVADGLEFYRVPNPGALLDRLPVVNQWRVVDLLRRRLRALIAEVRPDLIHAHSPCLDALAALGLGRPVVYEMRSSWEDAAVSTGTTREGSLRYRASRALESHVLRRADAVTTICEGLRAEIIGRGVAAEAVTVVPNAVDAEGFAGAATDPAAMRARFGLGERRVLGFIGSFFAWEGLALLIEALPLIRERAPQACVLLVGGGVHEPALRAAVRERGLEAHVIFAGQVPHRDVAALYAAIDVLVYPRLPMRLTEMVTPLKPLEAMALGKPLIASDVGGHRELIRDGETGLLFRAGSAASLAQAAGRLLGTPALAAALAANGPRFVRAERLWSTVVPRYRDVYARVLGRVVP